jgi:hypothetical protein
MYLFELRRAFYSIQKTKGTVKSMYLPLSMHIFLANQIEKPSPKNMQNKFSGQSTRKSSPERT